MTSVSDQRSIPAGVSVKALALVLFGALAGMQALLWRFLGLPWWAELAGIAGLSAVLFGLWRASGWSMLRVGWRVLGGVFLFALALLALGGEGRFFYANTDWQVRLAVLRDLTLNPWPFAYAGADPLVLRAPLGIYLLPALIGKLTSPYGAELALWVQNSALLAVLLGLGAALFDSARARRIALVVVAGFSGMDAIGQWLAGKSLRLHMEQWAGLQYSSHITQAFWVPQHALAGWIFAALFLLWRVGYVPVVAVLAVMPLLALLSPLALIGCVPFAALAFMESAWRQRLRWGDVGWPVLAGIICLPGLGYLVAGSAAVGAGASRANFNGYTLFLMLEIGGYVCALWQAGKSEGFGGRFGAATLAIAVLFLILAPFGQIGEGMDFTMRASIPALAILAVMVADLLLATRSKEARRLALGVFLIGVITPAGEIARAIVWPRSPLVACSYPGVVPGGAATYVAARAKLPAVLRSSPAALVAPRDPAPCWQGRWPDAATGRDVTVHPPENH